MAAPLDQDWKPVTMYKSKRSGGGGGGGGTSTSTGGSGGSVKRYGAGGNSRSTTGDYDARKIDAEDEVFQVPKVERSLAQKIQQARQAKGMTQKQLATAINERQQVVGDYERGSAIPNSQVISKLERALGTKLRERKKGKGKSSTRGGGGGGKKKNKSRA